MATTPIIGIDPHKRSHTAVIIDDREEIIAQIRIDASHRQVDQLLAWAPPDPDRIWAVENARGLGHLLAQQLLGRGETVIDVPATMAARTRSLSGKSGRKTDEHDARSVAITAAHHRGLQQVTVEDMTAVIGLLLDRRWQLVSQRQRTIVQLHATLTELTPRRRPQPPHHRQGRHAAAQHPAGDGGAGRTQAGVQPDAGRLALAQPAHPTR